MAICCYIEHFVFHRRNKTEHARSNSGTLINSSGIVTQLFLMILSMTLSRFR